MRALCRRKISTSIHDCARRWRTSGSPSRPARAHASMSGSIASSCSTCSFHTNEAPRSLASVVLATRQPSCSGPMRFSTGTSTSSRKTSLNSLSPVIWRSGRTSTPFAVIGIASIEIPVVRRRVGVGAHRARCPSSAKRRVRRPHLLTGHDVDAAALLGARREAGEVAARVGLAEQLAPDVVAGEDPRHPPPALLLGAVRHQRRPDEADAGASEERRRAARGRAPRCRSRPASATRPARRTRPASGCRPTVRRAAFAATPRSASASSAVVATLDVGRRVLAQPRAQLGAELLVVRGHRATAARTASARRRRRRELEVQLLEAAEQVDGRVLVAAGAGRAVRRLRDPDVGHAVEDAFEADARLGPGERRAGAGVDAEAEPEVLAAVRRGRGGARRGRRTAAGRGSRRR